MATTTTTTEQVKMTPEERQTKALERLMDRFTGDEKRLRGMFDKVAKEGHNRVELCRWLHISPRAWKELLADRETGRLSEGKMKWYGRQSVRYYGYNLLNLLVQTDLLSRLQERVDQVMGNGKCKVYFNRAKNPPLQDDKPKNGRFFPKFYLAVSTNREAFENLDAVVERNRQFHLANKSSAQANSTTETSG